MHENLVKQRSPSEDQWWDWQISSRIRALYYVTNRVALQPDSITEAHPRLVFNRISILAANLEHAATIEWDGVDKKRLKRFHAELLAFPTEEEALTLPYRRIIEEMEKVFRLSKRMCAALNVPPPED